MYIGLSLHIGIQKMAIEQLYIFSSIAALLRVYICVFSDFSKRVEKLLKKE